MTDPLLSVVVPFYGVEDYIADSLESIRAQNVQDIEVILVNDGSPDNSLEVAQDFADKDSRFRVISQPNGGVGKARNTGTREATGRYLLHMDGDDLVSRTGFELMVASLERTGSSFALSNARRFSRTAGVRQSWTHGGICATNVIGTDIFARPALVQDRMLWNKVYRHSFWRDQGYTFPEMRYEDWPVALAAHLDAVTVDIISAHTYYWRERESGDSITQQVFAYDNLLDRVVSAGMITDLVARKGTPAIRERAHTYLAAIDLNAIWAAFSVVPDEDIDSLLELGARLMSMLRFNLAGRPRIEQIQYHALRDKDVPLLRELARFRDTGGLVGGVPLRRSVRRPWRYDAQFPRSIGSSAPARVYTYPLTSLKLMTAITHVRWDGDVLVVQGRAEIAHRRAGPDHRIGVNAVTGVARVALPVTHRRTSDMRGGVSDIGFETRVDVAALAKRSDMVWPLRFEVELTSNGVHRIGMLRGMFEGSPRSAPARRLGDDALLQPGISQGGELAVFRVYAPVVITDASADGPDLVLRGTIPDRCTTGSLRIERVPPLGPVIFPCELTPVSGGTDFAVRMPTAEILEGDHVDNPFTLMSVRAVTLMTDIGGVPLSWPDYCGDVCVPVGSTLVALTRTPFGRLRLQHGPARPSAREVVPDGDRVVVRGAAWGAVPVHSMAWRRYLPGSDDFVETACSYVGSEGQFTATAEARALVPAHDEPVRPGSPAADWTLFAHLPEGDFPVVCEPAAATLLPWERAVAGRLLTLTTAATTVRAQVR